MLTPTLSMGRLPWLRGQGRQGATTPPARITRE